jgi:RNA polymerase sigma factor (sigma-70 family)
VLPPELSALLGAKTPASREAAWKLFLETHSRLLLHTARSVDRDHDAAMDAYAHLLEQLERDDFRRLRGYADDDRGKFTTWLVVVARRLCLDRVRQRYGRVQGDAAESRESHDTRRRLLDHLSEGVDVAELAGDDRQDAESRLRIAELIGALKAGLAGLEPGDRLLLKLRFEDGLSAREIAQLLKAPTVFHIYRRLNALLAQLREGLERRGVREAEP